MPLAGTTYIDLPILEPLLQVVVDGLVGHLADQGKIGDTNLLLLRSVKGRLLDIRLTASSTIPTALCLLGLVAFGSPTDTLFEGYG